MAGMYSADWTCDECYDRFCSKDDLERHEADVYGDYFQCNVCDREFRMESALLNHGRACHDYCCQPCLLFFEFHSGYKTHVNNAHNFPCRVCNSVFTTRSALNDHLDLASHRIGSRNYKTYVNIPQNLFGPVSLHLPTQPRQQAPPQQATLAYVPPRQIEADPGPRCEPCRATFESYISLAAHNTTVHVFKCDECTVELNDMVALQNHQKEAHWIKCICGNKLRDQAALERHRRKHHAFACSRCEIELETFADFKIHIEKMHEFKCNKCPAVFFSQDHNSSHHSECHSLSCKKCQKLFDTSKALLQHMNENHEFQCGKCNSGVFAGPAALALHEIAAHTIRCKHCQATFPSLTALHEHIDEKHYLKCWECTDSGFFADPDALALHEMAVHTIPCKHCRASFSTQTVLDRHINENHLFKCRKCDYSGVFADPATLLIHERVSHAIPCNYCQATFSSQTVLDKHCNENHHLKCEKCSYSGVFTDPAALSLHEKRLTPLLVITAKQRSQPT